VAGEKVSIIGGQKMNAKVINDFKSPNELRDLMGEPMDLAARKSVSKLDKYSKEYISRSPFVCIGSADETGKADVSPRGDPPGFVQVLDDNTLFIPDRPGNRRVDTMSNIISNPNIALLFLIPGFDDTLRVNGRAEVIQDDGLNAKSEVKGRKPKVGIKMHVEQVFFHCSKAFRRAGLWDADKQQERAEMPSIGRMILEQTAESNSAISDAEIEEVDELVEDDARERLY
jgi:PPOX class probable FMN-dependent enzyme